MRMPYGMIQSVLSGSLAPQSKSPSRPMIVYTDTVAVSRKERFEKSITGVGAGVTAAEVAEVVAAATDAVELAVLLIVAGADPAAGTL